MDIYGKVYVRVIRAQVIFITGICFRDLFGQLLYIKRIERKEPGQVPDFLFHGVGSLRASSPI